MRIKLPGSTHRWFVAEVDLSLRDIVKCVPSFSWLLLEERCVPRNRGGAAIASVCIRARKGLQRQTHLLVLHLC
jgi:hypothetical protein